MSLSVKTVDGEVTTNFVGVPIDGVAIGEHEIPLEHFCVMATHFLGGGFFGWGGETPECVEEALSGLFALYTPKKWTRKSMEELAGETKPEKEE